MSLQLNSLMLVIHVIILLTSFICPCIRDHSMFKHSVLAPAACMPCPCVEQLPLPKYCLKYFECPCSKGWSCNPAKLKCSTYKHGGYASEHKHRVLQQQITISFATIMGHFPCVHGSVLTFRMVSMLYILNLMWNVFWIMSTCLSIRMAADGLYEMQCTLRFNINILQATRVIPYKYFIHSPKHKDKDCYEYIHKAPISDIVNRCLTVPKEVLHAKGIYLLY